MRDPELKLRTHRRVYVLPRQVTGASLEEIGRQFGGKHHTTVLHAVNRIDAMSRIDEVLKRTMTRLMDEVVAQI